MASIPLPALDVRPPAPQANPLEQYQHLMALKNMQVMQPLQQQAAQQSVQSGALQLQQQQQDLKDQQGISKWFQSIDPKDPNAFDPATVGKTLANAGVSGKGIMAAQNQLLEHQKTVLGMTKDQIANQQEVSGNIYNGIDGIIGETDPNKRAQAITPLLQTAAKNNIIPPQQAAQMLANVGSITDDQLKAFQHGLGVSSGFMEAVAKQQEAKYKVVNGTLMDVSGTTPKPAMAGQLNPQQWSDAVDSVVPPSGANQALNTRTKSQVNFYVQQGNLEGAQKAISQASEQVGAIEKETNPQVQQNKIATAAAEGAARANIEAQTARGSDAALAQVPPHLVGPASAAANKAGQDYAQANSVSQRIAEMLKDARSGNVVSYQLLPQEGALQLTTSQGVKRINMAEIQNYGGGSLWQDLQGHIGKALTGQSIPPSVLNDMSQIQDLMARGSDVKYANELNTINQTYGSKFKPVQMQNMAPAGGGAGAPKVGDVKTFPNGKKGKWDGTGWEAQ